MNLVSDLEISNWFSDIIITGLHNVEVKYPGFFELKNCQIVFCGTFGGRSLNSEGLGLVLKC